VEQNEIILGSIVRMI